MAKSRLAINRAYRGDPIRPMAYHRNNLEARWVRDGEGYDHSQFEVYEDPTIGTNRPSERGGLKIEPDNVERVRDLIIVKLQAKRVSFSVIGAILNLKKTDISNRFYAIPENVRRYYASVELG